MFFLEQKKTAKNSLMTLLYHLRAPADFEIQNMPLISTASDFLLGINQYLSAGGSTFHVRKFPPNFFQKKSPPKSSQKRHTKWSNSPKKMKKNGLKKLPL